MGTQTQAYVGKGIVYLGEIGKALVDIGEADKVEFSYEEDKKELPTARSAGGGIAVSLTRIKSCTLGLKINNLSPENLAIAMRGTAEEIAGAVVADEVHIATVGGLVKFNKIPSRSVALTVKSEDGTTTFVEGRDYVRVGAGAEIPQGSTIADGDEIKVGYTALSSMKLEALVETGKEYRLVFDGINEVTGKRMVVEAYRVKPGLAKNWSLIGDDFGALEIDTEVLKDETRTGAGLSQFYTADIEV